MGINGNVCKYLRRKIHVTGDLHVQWDCNICSLKIPFALLSGLMHVTSESTKLCQKSLARNQKLSP